MLSTVLQESFRTLAKAASDRAEETFRERGQVVTRQFYDAGHHGYSSPHVKQLSLTAAEVFEQGAGETYQALIDAYEAEPGPSTEISDETLLGLLDSQLAELGHRVSMALGERIDPMRALAANPVIYAESANHTSLAVDATRNELRAKLQIHLKRAQKSATGGQYFQFGNYASIGALQTGRGAAATVTQTVSHSGREEFKAALDSLIAVINASTVPVTNSEEILDLLQDVKAEVDKPKPNKLKVGSALSSIGTTVSLIADGPAAYENAMTCWEALKSIFV